LKFFSGIDGKNGTIRFDQLLLRVYAKEIITGSKAAALKNLKLSEF
jgi:hypothetical protein